MASRSTLRTWIRNFLGTESDDPAFVASILDPIIQQAADSLVAEIHRQNPQFLVKTTTLAADSATSHNYTFASQAVAITDFAGWLEVRWDDSEGLELHEVRLDELGAAGQDHFTLTGLDESVVLVTSPDSGAGTPVWLRYRYWPTELTSGSAGDTEVPGGIPKRFHDVIALEALFAFGLGGEQARPPELRERWLDRRSQLLTSVGRRGSQQSRTRVYTDIYE